MKDGLISNYVQSILQDSRSYLWIGTSAGISVFDGYSFKSYSSSDGLPEGSIRCFCESVKRPGLLWIGTMRDGIYQYDGKSFKKVTAAANNPCAVYAMVEDCRGVLWCATSSGLFTIQNDHLSEVKLTEGSGDPFSLIELNDSTIIIGTHNKLLQYSQITQKIAELYFGYYADPKTDRLILLAKENEATFWVLTNSGLLVRYSNGSARLIHSFPWDYATFIHRDNAGNMWVGRDAGGLYKFQINAQHPVPISIGIENGLPENSIWTMIVDREDNLWFGTHANGIVRLSQQYITRFPFDKWALKLNDRSVVLDTAKHFWVATSYGLREVWKDPDETWHSVLHAVSHIPLVQDVIAIQYDSLKTLWLVYRNSILEGHKIISIPGKPSRLSFVRRLDLGRMYPGRPPVDLYVDRQNYLWYSMNGLGVAVLDPSLGNPVVRVFTMADGLPDQSVGFICEDDSGNIWFATTLSGVVKVEGGLSSRHIVQLYTTANGLHSDNVACIYRDRAGRIWAGTNGGGATVIENSSCRTISRKDGLPSNTVGAIEEDDFGNIWLGASGGPAYVSPRDNWKVHVVHDMLGETVQAITKGPEGLVSIQSDIMFNIIDMNVPRRPSTPPPIYLTDFDVDGEHMVIDSTHELSHTQKYLRVGFLGISLKNENQLTYQYKLQNFDTDWRPPITERSVILAAPKPGKYIFMVRAVTPDGIASTMPAVLRFNINPPFYQQLWFIGMAAVLLSAIIYGVVRGRIQKALREQREQQEFSRRLIDSQEQERKRIAAELHDSIGQELLIIKNRALLGLEACPEDNPAKKELERISNISSQTIGEIREISYNLRPYQLDRLGLTKAIQSIITRVEGASHIRFESDIAPIDNLFPKEHEINIYRIVQEGINNALKHAQASKIYVKVEKGNDTVTISIKDDGRGFDAAKTFSNVETQGFGLRGISERVRILGGKFSIASSVKSGTILLITLQC